ncbi:MAG: SET domain-containing protein [Minisyncoccia bacterium]
MPGGSPKEKFLIVKKNNKGYGVYAGKNYKKGEVICKIKGKSYRNYNLYFDLKNIRNYRMNPLQIAAFKYLNLNKPYLYFNHSCEPNAGIKNKSTLFALQFIKKGEEICYDYSTTIDESFVCKCGALKCRGAVSDFFALPKKLQKYYINLNAVPNFIKNKYNKLNKLNKGR